jgi:hypothetical protein
MLTRRFFSLVLKAVRADCVCDIGSRDGEESLFFRHLLPHAVVLAFEASPKKRPAPRCGLGKEPLMNCFL